MDFRKRTRDSTNTPDSAAQIAWKNDIGMLFSVGTLVLMRIMLRLFKRMTNNKLKPPQQSVRTNIFDANLLLRWLIFFYYHYPSCTNFASEAISGHEKLKYIPKQQEQVK